MLTNEASMRAALIDLNSKLRHAESRLKGRRTIYHKIKHLELQERCETLLEDVNREFGDTEKHLNEFADLETNVVCWLARLESDDT